MKPTGAAAGKYELSGVVTQFTYNFNDQFTGGLKAESSTDKVADNKISTYSNYGAFFLKKLNGNNVNFHMAYNVFNTKNENATTTIGGIRANQTATENQILIGFKIYADLIK